MFNVAKKASSNRLSVFLLSIALASGLFAVGCGNDLNEEKNDNNPTENSNNNNNTPDDVEEGKTYPNITHKKSADGVTTTTVNSTSLDKWIYLQLSTSDETTVSDPKTANNWDLAFQRFSLLVNGGVSGASSVEIAHLNGAKFEDIKQAPAADYRTDVEGITDERGQNPGLAFLADDTWYNYDGATHLLSVRDRVYVIHATTGEYFKVQFLDYYDLAGTGGFVQFKWQKIDAPEGTETPVDPVDPVDPEVPTFQILTNTIDATSADTFVYVDVATNAEVVVADPATSAGWELAFQKTTVVVNGGVSGVGNVAIAHVDGVDFADVTEESATDFRTDETAAGAAFKADSNWYAYDMTTHTLSVRDRVYLVKNAGGNLFKVQLVSYYGQDNIAGHITLKSQQLK